MTGILITLALLLLAAGVWIYNRLIRNRNRVNEAWAGIDVQLQKRSELVPNLVQTVKAQRMNPGCLKKSRISAPTGKAMLKNVPGRKPHCRDLS
ncbi:MAG: LemA family protein, partial [Gammaproteobacteria bacterium]|nr:LemA family protein [Gammaproteobacteria bacterium]